MQKFSKSFVFELNENIITAELPEDNLQGLLVELLDATPPASLLFEDLPVEETMRSFLRTQINILSDFNIY